jgi:hypothetical protein
VLNVDRLDKHGYWAVTGYLGNTKRNISNWELNIYCNSRKLVDNTSYE